MYAFIRSVVIRNSEMTEYVSSGGKADAAAKSAESCCVGVLRHFLVLLHLPWTLL
jgi:hypothetical protein